MFPPSKIAGLRIAYGRATWIEDEKGEGHYTFVDDAFMWAITHAQLAEMQVDEGDLLDTVEQAEKQFGAPEDYRPALGLLPKMGVMNIGATFISQSNPAITCVFTPTSIEAPPNYRGDNFVSPDAYFEWYYCPETEPKDNLEAFLNDFDRLSGTRTTNISQSPIVVPSYEEACAKANLMGLEESQKFVQDVWNYHKVPMPFYYKDQMKKDLVETWNRLKRVERVLKVYES